MTILRTTLSLAALLLTSTAALAQSVASPDGRMTATLTVDGEGKPNWSVTRDGEPLIAPSGLGFNIEDEDPLRRNFAVVAQGTSSAESTWEQPWGERQFVVDRHNELAVTFRQQDAMAREFLWIAAHPEEARAQAMRGREMIVRDWNREKAFGDLRSILETVVAERKAR